MIDGLDFWNEKDVFFLKSVYLNILVRMHSESGTENGEFVIVVCKGSAMVPEKCQKKCLGYSI